MIFLLLLLVAGVVIGKGYDERVRDEDLQPKARARKNDQYEVVSNQTRCRRG